MINKSKLETINEFWTDFGELSAHRYEIYGNTSVAIGVLDGVYPIALIGQNNWIQNIYERYPLGQDIIVATKTYRKSNNIDTLFCLRIENNDVYFTVPNLIANKIISNIDESHDGDTIFVIDVPYINNRLNNKVSDTNLFNESRRIFKIVVKLNYDDIGEYLQFIKDLNTNSVSKL